MSTRRSNDHDRRAGQAWRVRDSRISIAHDFIEPFITTSPTAGPITTKPSAGPMAPTAASITTTPTMAPITTAKVPTVAPTVAPTTASPSKCIGCSTCFYPTLNHFFPPAFSKSTCATFASLGAYWCGN
ncbi:hypothetical protein DYB28_007347 [Aphanomyces astaci]|uniref:Uncharacterized protein n=1 Tax=Aphanomyces astaci TaxID=112090 RepID=A0A9X8H7X2_APHAT|nr:hypothetical protein DYB28_007347 [Aphanomyces astaci]